VKKLVLVVVLLFTLTGCGKNVAGEQNPNVEQESNRLIFNTPVEEYMLEISWMPHAFHLSITDEQILAVFPFFELVERNEWSRTVAEYQLDGTLAEFGLNLRLIDDTDNFRIDVGVGERPRISSEIGFARDFEFIYSDIYGVLVRAIMVYNEWSEQRNFVATFVIDSIYYRILFKDYEKNGQMRMNEIVSTIILNNPLDFTAIENPNIPYMRSDEMSLDEARLDSQFGIFIPTMIPEELTFRGGYRSIQEHWNNNTLLLHWNIIYDEQYLYEIFTSWVKNRTIDTPVFEFERVFWGGNEFRWLISERNEWLHGELVSAIEFMMSDDPQNVFWHPTFLVDELTFELIQRLERITGQYSLPQGAYWDEGVADYNVQIPFKTSRFQFGIIIDDVVIDLWVGRGSTPEMIWSLIQSLPVLNN